MSIDLNTAEPQGQAAGEPIPEGTCAPVILHLREIKTGKSGATGLDVEYTVTAGPFKGRKAWGWVGIAGNGSEGHDKMVKISLSYIRGMWESGHGIDPTDDSPAAMAARQLSEWEDLDGLEFVARFKIEAPKPYTDERTGETKTGKPKNTLQAVTPDDPDYAGFKPARPKAKTSSRPASNSAAKQPAAAAAAGGKRPDWA